MTDFKKNPEHSRISPSTRALLYRLKKRHKVIMVTGRYADSLIKVSGLKGFPIIGTHGFEAKNLPSRLQFASLYLRRQFKKEATRLWNTVKALPRRYPGIHIERKPYSSTLHFRGTRLTKPQIAGLKHEFKRFFRRSVTAKLWTLQSGKMMLEAMPKGFSKGKAVAKILKKFQGYQPIYAGDDVGDIPVLKALGKKGIKVTVGRRIPRAFADLRFSRPRNFVRWLGKLALREPRS